MDIASKSIFQFHGNVDLAVPVTELMSGFQLFAPFLLFSYIHLFALFITSF